MDFPLHGHPPRVVLCIAVQARALIEVTLLWHRSGLRSKGSSKIKGLTTRRTCGRPLEVERQHDEGRRGMLIISGVSEDNFSSILRASKLSGVMKKLERLLVTSEHNLLPARANLLIR